MQYGLLLVLIAASIAGDEGLRAEEFYDEMSSSEPQVAYEPQPETLQPGQYCVISNVPKDSDWPVIVKATICVEGPPEQVWKVVTDYEGHQGTVPFVHHCKVVERNENRLILDYIMKGRVLLIFPWELKLRLALRETPAEVISFNLLEGSLKRYEGCVTLTPREEEQPLTLLSYQVEVQPDFFVPRWAMRWGLNRDLPKMLKAMRELVLFKKS